MPYFLCNLKSVKYCVPFLMSGHFPLEWHCRKKLIAGVATRPIQSLAINIYRPYPCIVAPCKQQKITPQALCCAPDSHTHIITIKALFFFDAVLHIITDKCTVMVFEKMWYQKPTSDADSKRFLGQDFKARLRDSVFRAKMCCFQINFTTQSLMVRGWIVNFILLWVLFFVRV